MSVDARNLKHGLSLLKVWNDESNCWGLTAYVLGWRKRLYYMDGNLMERRLETRLRLIPKPKRFRIGDVVAKFSKNTGDLLHTSIYVGKCRWLHQIGYGHEIRLDRFGRMIRCYAGIAEYYRV